VGADPPGGRGDAGHAAGDDHDRDAVHLSGALSRGTSQPEAINTARNLEAAGYTHRLDLDAQASVSEHFDQLARAKELLAGAPREFDAL
jgi:hypothetical protein